MTRRMLVLLALAVAGCSDAPTAPRRATPAVTGTTTPLNLSVSITGPDALAPGTEFQYQATATYADGTTEDVTTKASWASSKPQVLEVHPNGNARGQQRGASSLSAKFGGVERTIAVRVLEPGTFVVSGTIVGLFDRAVAGATVEVESGTGAGLSTTTNGGGAFEIYGVAGAVQLKLSAPGFQSRSVGVLVTGDIATQFLLTPEATGFLVSGTVWLHDATGVAPAQGGTVFGWTERPTNGRTTGPVGISAGGRYGFATLKDTIWVSVLGGPGFQPCAAAKAITGNTTLDVHRVVDKNQLGANLPAALLAQTPTLSGVVYENTTEGRRPISGAWVTLDGLDGMGVMVADTLTDAQGRYILCSVPQKPSMAIVVGAEGFDVAYAPANKTTLDIEMRRR